MKIQLESPLKKPRIESIDCIDENDCEHCNFLRIETTDKMPQHRQDYLGIVGYCPVREKWSFVNRTCKAWQERNK